MSYLYRKRAMEKLSSPEQLDKMIVITPLPLWIAIAAGFLLLVSVTVWGMYGKIPVIKNCQGVYYDMGNIQVVYSDTEGIVREINLDTGDTVKKGDVLMVIEDEQGEQHQVKAECDGAVFDPFAKKGSYVSKGSELMQIREENSSEAGYVYCYIGLAAAGQIKEGMEVKIAPDYLNTNEYGHMIGKVASVSRFIVNRSDLLDQIGNEDVIDSLLSNQAMISIRCELEKDENSVNGYKWSSEKGNTLELLNGTLINAQIVIDEKTPLSLMFD